MKEGIYVKNHKVLVAIPDGYTRDTFFTPMVRDRMAKMPGLEFIWNMGTKQFSKEEIGNILTDCSSCILGWGAPRLTTKMLQEKDQLKLIAILGGGVKPYIEEDFFDKTDKTLINQTDVMAKSVAEATLAYMLSGLRDIPYYDHGMKNSFQWRSDKFFNQGLFYKTVGLVGLGKVGRYLIEFLKPFNVDIIIYDPYLDASTIEGDNITIEQNLDSLLSRADIISIHAGYTEETHHMLNKARLSKIKDGALLVNTARGGIIDEAALVEELKKNRFKAVLDVYEREPLSEDSGLRNLDNVVLIPHMAGPTIDMRQYMALALLNDIYKFLNGDKDLSCILNKERVNIMT